MNPHHESKNRCSARSCCLAAVVGFLVLSFACSSSAQVRINQVYSWGGLDVAGFEQDYVELYNAGTSEVSLSGFSLDLHDASTGEWITECLLNGTIAAKGHFLVALGSVGRGRALPTPDVSSGAYSLPHDDVALVVLWQLLGTEWAERDAVGIGGGAIQAEGGSPAPSASSAVQATRRVDPEVDSNNNGADFIVGLAEPLSSSIGVPTISAIAAQRINEGESSGPLEFQIADSDTSVDELIVSASSSNTALVPNSGTSLVLSGAGTDRTITVTPEGGGNGRAVITITVSDGRYEAATSFQVTVNSRPTISDIPDISLLEGSSIPKVVFEVGDAEMSSQTVVRVMAANTTSGNNQAYEEPGDRIFQGLKPDVALVQEFKVSTGRYPSIRAWVDANFGSDFHYYRESLPPGTQSPIPNGVVSRWPILDAGSWDDSLERITNREFAWARLDIPGDKDLWVVSLHFYASGTTGDRNTEAVQLIDYIRNNVPAADYVLIGGDLNTQTTSESCLATLASEFVVASPGPSDEDGDIDTNAGRNKPLDWIFAEPELDALETPLIIGSRRFDHGLVFDSRVFSDLPSVAPVQVGDSGVFNMQHMAVLREFTLPAPASLRVTVTSSNQALVREEDIVVSGEGADCTIAVTPQAGATGATTITVTVSDGEASASDQFVLEVEAKTFDSWIARTRAPENRRAMSDRNGPAAVSNLIAYAMGIDPMDAVPTDMPQVAEVAGDASGSLLLAYSRAKLRSGVSVHVEGSHDLATWLPAEVVSEQVASLSEAREEVLALVTVPNGTKYFVRLKAAAD